MFFDNEEIKAIKAIAKEAGSLIIQRYKDNTMFNLKTDDTPLTEVDLLSHEIVYSGLKKLTPNIPILSEEGEYIPFDKRKKWSEYWLIDPLDGTRGFINKTDDFCICIAYIKNNKPVFGLVYAPILDTYYLANSKNLAYKIEGGNWQQIHTKKQSKVLKVVAGKYVNQTKLKKRLSNLGIDNCKIFGLGSALKFCFLAEGKYDYYPGVGICSEWDTAAGNFIVQAAGGHVADIFNNPLQYNLKNDMLSPIFFASGDFKISRDK